MSKDYFDELATGWDELRQHLFSNSLREQALQATTLVAGRTAADFGAGTGFITEGLLTMGLRVIAIDQSTAMIEEMQNKFKGQDVAYIMADAEEVPVLTASVDYVFANMFLHHVKKPALVIREMVRILKAGGKLIITDMDEHPYTFLQTEHFDRWLGFRRQELQRWFIAAGLTNVAVRSVDT